MLRNPLKNLNDTSSVYNAIIRRLRRVYHYFLHPRTHHSADILREKTIRLVTTLTALVFLSLGIVDVLTANLNLLAVLFYGLLAAFVFGIFYNLNRSNIQRAAYVLSASMILMAFDQTAAFWSPGTVIFTIMYSLLFTMVYKRRRDIAISIFFNMALYTIITLRNVDSPLSTYDYFSSPYSALVVTYTVNLMMVGVANYIRQAQYQQDQFELTLERQKSDILRQFLGNTSHDLRTGLSVIRTKMYLTKREIPQENRKTFDQLETSVDQLEQAILSMIELSQLDDTTAYLHEPVDVDTLIRTTLKPLEGVAQAKALKIKYIPMEKYLTVYGDEELLRRALRNVIKNAIDYTDAGTITIGLTNSAGKVNIAISDTGIGISADEQGHIFDRFYRVDKARSNPNGRVGLGLSIAQKILTLHNGQIHVESEPGKGSTFVIQLPVK